MTDLVERLRASGMPIDPDIDPDKLADIIETLRNRVERLRGLCKSASGWLLDANDIDHADDLLRLVGDMEPVTYTHAGHGEPVAWMTYNSNGEHMLWGDLSEATLYCDDDETPTPLYTAPPDCFSAADMADAQAKAAMIEREECVKVCDRFAARGMHPSECAAAIRMRSNV